MKKIIVCILLLVFTSNNLSASEVYERPKVALVLSGGGAKGVVHIGVLKVLEEEGIPIDMIVGTSMGAVLGGMYSMGYNAKQLDSIISNIDWVHFLSDNTKRENVLYDKKLIDDKYLVNIPFSSNPLKKNNGIDLALRMGSGLIEGQNILNLIIDLSLDYQGNINFDSLPIPFACVATDISTGKATVFRDGNLPMAIRASMAIPGVFTATKIDGGVYIDGGMVNNYPVDVAKSMGADIVIGVDLANDLAKPEDINSVFKIFSQMISLSDHEMYKKNIIDVDLNIKPDVSNFSMFSFKQESIDSLITNGYKAADENRIKLREMFSGIELLKKKRPAKESVDSFMLRNILYNGVKQFEIRYLEEIVLLKTNTITSIHDIEGAISRLAGIKSFTSVTYCIKNSGDSCGGYDLCFNLTKKAEHEFKLGLYLNSEDVASIPFYVGLWENTFNGSLLWFDGNVSITPYVGIGYSFSIPKMMKFDLSYKFSKVDMDVYRATKDINSLEFIENQLTLSATKWFIKNMDISIGATLKHYYFPYKSIRELNTNIPHSRDLFLHYFLRSTMDNRDNINFPTKGVYLNADVNFNHKILDDNIVPFFSAGVNVTGALSFGKIFTVLPSFYSRVLINNVYIVPFLNYVGGDTPSRYLSQQIPFIGLNGANYVENSVIVGRLDLRSNVWKNHYVYLLLNYMRTDMNFVDMFTKNGDGYWGVGLKYAYRTPIGPISASVSWSDFSKNVAVFACFGYVF